MADYKFDGKELRCKGNLIGKIDGEYIRDHKGEKVGKIDGLTIRDAKGSKISQFDGKTIRDGSGSRICELGDLKKQVDGTGGISLVAIWLFFVR